MSVLPCSGRDLKSPSLSWGDIFGQAGPSILLQPKRGRFRTWISIQQNFERNRKRITLFLNGLTKSRLVRPVIDEKNKSENQALFAKHSNFYCTLRVTSLP